MAEKFYLVKNRSASRVCYSIPEDRIRRVFAPGEVKRISHSELLKLTYQPGGREIMVSFLQIQSEKALREFNINAQPEYYMSEEQIVELLRAGSVDAFLDCLDYAPVGVIDLIKKYAVEMPLSDYNKKHVLLEKTGFDVDKAIANEKSDKTVEKDAENPAAEKAPTGRRTKPNYGASSTGKSLNKTAQ